MNLPVPSQLPFGPRGPRAIVAPRQALVAAIASRLGPVLRTSLVAAAAGLGVEVALRTVISRALTAMRRDAAQVVRTSAAAGTRTIVTEFVVRERVRRVR